MRVKYVNKCTVKAESTRETKYVSSEVSTNRKRRDFRTYTSTKVARYVAACSKRKKLSSMATNHDVDFREELEKLRKEDETNSFCFDCGKESNRSDFTS